MFVETIRGILSSERTTNSPTSRKRALLYWTGIIDSVSIFSCCSAITRLTNIFLIAQTPVVTHGFARVFGDGHPLRILGCMLGFIGLGLSSSNEAIPTMFLVFTVTVLDSFSILLKARYMSSVVETTDMNRMNWTIGSTRTCATGLFLVVCWWLDAPVMNKAYLVYADIPEMKDIFTACCWGVLSALTVDLAVRFVQSSFSPLISFLACSVLLISYLGFDNRNITQLCGQGALLVSAILLCIPKATSYRETSTEMNLLTRTTE